MSCEHELCREPDNRPAYVTDEDGSTFCLFCYLVWVKGMDASEAADVTFEGGKPDK